MKIQSITIAILLMFISGCKPHEQKKPVTSETVHIRIQPVEMRAYKIPARATGILSTMTQVKLSFMTGGIIKKVDVREGEAVRRGQVLAVLDLSEIRAQVNQASIGYDKSQRDLTRARNLYNDSVATLEQYQNARSAFELAKAQKQIADFNLLHSQIKAPSDGKIQKILVETNEMIGPGYPAILFASTENDWIVRVALTDKDIVRLSIGDSAKVIMDAFPGTEFSAQVTELGSVADPLSGTYEAELMILQNLPQFRTGFISRVEIYPAESVLSLVVPMEALLDAGDHSASVYSYTDKKAVMKKIRTGMILDDGVVVTEGLNEGEMVITDGNRYLRKDSKVQLANPTDPAEK